MFNFEIIYMDGDNTYQGTHLRLKGMNLKRSAYIKFHVANNDIGTCN